jgi:hypothetical protein
MKHAILCLGLVPACGLESDVDAYIVLPATCFDLGVTRAELAIGTADGESFTVTADACTDRLAGEELSGFAAQIERLGAGHHRAEVALFADDDTRIGGRGLVFADDAPLIVSLGRPDLPRWPTAPVDVAITGCDPSITDLQLTAVGAGAYPGTTDAVVDVACTGDAAGTARVELVRGEASLTLDAACYHAATTILVFDDAEPVDVALTRSCP